jgi:hypothetical protein
MDRHTDGGTDTGRDKTHMGEIDSYRKRKTKGGTDRDSEG